MIIGLDELFGTEDGYHAIFQALQRVSAFPVVIETISDGGITIDHAYLAYVPRPFKRVKVEKK